MLSELFFIHDRNACGYAGDGKQNGQANGECAFADVLGADRERACLRHERGGGELCDLRKEIENGGEQDDSTRSEQYARAVFRKRREENAKADGENAEEPPEDHGGQHNTCPAAWGSAGRYCGA